MKKNFPMQIIAALTSLTCVSVLAADNHSQTIAVLDQKGKLHWLQKNADAQLQKKPATSSATSLLRKSLNIAPLPLEDVKGGGIGGNEKTGFIYYDGLPGKDHREALSIQRNPITKICYLQNKNITVRDWNHDLDVVEFPCAEPDKNHNGVYWNPNFDFVNGTYNPGLDAFYAAQTANHMYENWFYEPMWGAHNVTLLIHASDTYFNEGGMFSDGKQPWYVSLSDGDDKTYAWTTLDVVSHFLSVGAALSYWGYAWGVGNSPSIAMSYSDAFAKAVEFSINKKNIWTIGGDVTKSTYYPLRSMENPTRDCGDDKKPGESCSIAHYDDFKKHHWIEPEYGAGLLNKVFYLLSTSPGFDTEQAFRLLNHATYYWMDRDWYFESNKWPEDNFSFYGVFCSLMTSAKDFKYDQAKIDTLSSVLQQVGMDTKACIEKLNPPVKK